jgi:ribosomal protein S18 acetylase RimI-like enzyme
MAEEVPVSLVIRRATRDDVEALLGLASRMANFELPRWRSAAEITEADGRDMINAIAAESPDHEVVLAERDGSAAGCLYVLVATDFFGRQHAHISVIVTSEAAEGSGIGRALMTYAEEWARARDLPLLTLNVFAGNTRACRFYENAGFGVEMLKYAKPLGSPLGSDLDFSKTAPGMARRLEKSRSDPEG